MSKSGLITKILAPAVSFPTLFDYASRNLLVTFNYHEISDNPSQFCNDFNLNVSPAIFAKHLLWIKKYFNVISPKQLMSGDYKRPAALVTFDDGFAGVFNQGAKLLKDANIPAIVFMNMAPVYGQTCWSALITYLCKYDKSFKQYISNKYNCSLNSNYFLYCTESDVQEFLESNGESVVEKVNAYHGKFVSEKELHKGDKSGLYIGNHLMNHYNAAILSQNDLKNQYLLNESEISRFENYVPFFSYPFGQPLSCYNSETHKLLFSLGSKFLFTAFPLFNEDKHDRVIHRTAMFNNINSEYLFRAHCLVPACMNYILRRHLWMRINKSNLYE